MVDFFRSIKRGRRKAEPDRHSEIYPKLMQLGQRRTDNRPLFKPTPRNLRYFSRTPYARRAINTIKNSIAMLHWEIRAKEGTPDSTVLRQQIETTHNCFDRPNEDDTFSALMEQVIEDYCCGAAAIEQQIGGDASRPLWMWPVDGLSIQIYPLWDGDPNAPRYVQQMSFGGSTVGMESQGPVFNSNELIYIRPNPTTAGPFGVGPLEVAFMTISRILGVSAYAGDVSSNASPVGLLHLGNVDSTAVDAFRHYWRNDVEGQGRTPITGGGDKPPTFLDLHPQGDQALYLKYQDFLKTEIAIAFDLSPQNLGVERDINRNTAEVAEDRDIAQAIGPTARKVASQLTRESIQQRLGYSQLEFHFLGLDREDEVAEAEIFEREYRNNATTPNEYRARRGRPLSLSPWADLTYADVQIAQSEARGTKSFVDENLSPTDVLPDDQVKKDSAGQSQKQVGGGPSSGGSPFRRLGRGVVRSKPPGAGR